MLKTLFSIIALSLIVSCTADSGKNGNEIVIPPTDEDEKEPVTECTGMSAEEAAAKIGRGINLGNTLDAPNYEGEWAPAAEDYFFSAYADAGFNSVRIPITWNKRFNHSSPYTIDPEFFARVEYLVDRALSEGLVVIINIHHDEYVKEEISKNNNSPLVGLWSQIATRFKDKSEDLLFEVINEPRFQEEIPTAAQIDVANQAALDIIRETNPCRNVILSGNNWTAINDMKEANFPTNDDHIIAYYHCYDPYPFGLEGTGTLTASGINGVKNTYKAAKTWSDAKGIPVIISEFGCKVDANFNDRMRLYAVNVEAALDNEIPFIVWDDHGWFKVYYRPENKWDDVKDILIHHTNKGMTNLEISKVSTNSVKLSWDILSERDSDVTIEHKVGDSYESVETVSAATTEITIENMDAGQTHIFRIKQGDESDFILSYPISIDL